MILLELLGARAGLNLEPAKNHTGRRVEALVSTAATSHGYVSTLQAVLLACVSADLVENLSGK